MPYTLGDGRPLFTGVLSNYNYLHYLDKYKVLIYDFLQDNSKLRYFTCLLFDLRLTFKAKLHWKAMILYFETLSYTPYVSEYLSLSGSQTTTPWRIPFKVIWHKFWPEMNRRSFKFCGLIKIKKRWISEFSTYSRYNLKRVICILHNL